MMTKNQRTAIIISAFMWASFTVARLGYRQSDRIVIGMIMISVFAWLIQRVTWMLCDKAKPVREGQSTGLRMVLVLVSPIFCMCGRLLGCFLLPPVLVCSICFLAVDEIKNARKYIRLTKSKLGRMFWGFGSITRVLWTTRKQIPKM